MAAGAEGVAGAEDVVGAEGFARAGVVEVRADGAWGRGADAEVRAYA
ncbi:hypothetical protein GA0115246_112861, partial [Streptomyces sp. SolWspMP-sol7th]